MNSIFHRVSIRKFQDKPVEPEKIETLLRAAMAAPSARNQQPWEFYVVTNKDLIQKLSTVSPYAGCAKDAPALMGSIAQRALPTMSHSRSRAATAWSSLCVVRTTACSWKVMRVD